MSWESEFESQWQTFLDTVETNVRREIKTSGSLDYRSVNTIIQKETAKWSNSTHYNGAWLRNLKLKYPLLGEEFSVILEQLNLDDKITLNLKSATLPFFAGTGMGLILVTFLILGWVEESLIIKMMGTGVVVLLTFPILANLMANQRKEIVNQIIEKIQKNLATTGDKLKNIAFQADRVS